MDSFRLSVEKFDLIIHNEYISSKIYLTSNRKWDPVNVL